MRNKLLFFLPMLVSCLPAYVHGQPAWTGIINPSRAIDWTSAGVIGGIPSYPACTSAQAATAVPIVAYSGSASTINTALSKCASANANGSYLALAAGTFSLTTGIDFSGLKNVALRGQGANQTLLIFSGGAGCNGFDAMVCLAPPLSAPGGSEGNVCNWTAGYSQGATTITIANCGTTTPVLGALGNLKIGSLLTVDQADTLNDSGTIWVCTNGAESAQAGSHCAQEANGGNGRNDGPCVNGICDREQQQVVRVTSCTNTAGVCTSGANITISPGLYMPNWTAAQSPQAWYGTNMAQGDGLENLSISDNNVTVTDFNITMSSCYGCWIKGIESLYAARGHVEATWGSHNTIQDSYFYGSVSGGSESYGVETKMWCDSLIQNNIFQLVTDSTPALDNVGTVSFANFGIKTNYTAAPGFAQASNYLHAGGDSLSLFEQNIGFGFTSDDVHGTHHFETLYRNFFPGWQLSCAGSPCAAQTNPFILMAGSRYFNVIGNVLGTPGYHTQYQAVAATTGTGANVPVSIYQMNYTGTNGNADSAVNGYCTSPSCSATSYFDPQTSASLLRWGNWDAVNKSAQWNSSEVPSGLASYANAVPTGQCTSSLNCPASFLYGSAPAWWGSLPWPAIGPGMTSGNIGQCTSGAYAMVAAISSSQCSGGSFSSSAFGGTANMTPAMNCAYNVMNMPLDGSGNALSFNAATCYSPSSAGGGPPPPSPPTVTLN